MQLRTEVCKLSRCIGLYLLPLEEVLPLPCRMIRPRYTSLMKPCRNIHQHQPMACAIVVIYYLEIEWNFVLPSSICSCHNMVIDQPTLCILAWIYAMVVHTTPIFNLSHRSSKSSTKVMEKLHPTDFTSKQRSPIGQLRFLPTSRQRQFVDYTYVQYQLKMKIIWAVWIFTWPCMYQVITECILMITLYRRMFPRMVYEVSWSTVYKIQSHTIIISILFPQRHTNSLSNCTYLTSA